MKSLVIIFSMFLAFNVTAKTQMTAEDYSTLNLDYINFENDLFDIEQVVFEDLLNINNEVSVNEVEVVELEEEVEIDFDTKKYLPERFVAYKGMHDLDWNTIELVEIEEEVEIANNLPKINCIKNSKTIIVSR